MEAERERAEEALRAEVRRQAAERAPGQLRMIAMMAFGAGDGVRRAWRLASGDADDRAAHSWGPAGFRPSARWERVRRVAARLADRLPRPRDPARAWPIPPAAAAAPWLLLGALALTGVSLLTAL